MELLLLPLHLRYCFNISFFFIYMVMLISLSYHCVLSFSFLNPLRVVLWFVLRFFIDLEVQVHFHVFLVFSSSKTHFDISLIFSSPRLKNVSF